MNVTEFNGANWTEHARKDASCIRYHGHCNSAFIHGEKSKYDQDSYNAYYLVSSQKNVTKHKNLLLVLDSNGTVQGPRQAQWQAICKERTKQGRKSTI